MFSLAQGNALGICICHRVIALKGQKYLAQGNTLGALGICICHRVIALWSHGDTLWLLICEHISIIIFNIIQFQKLPVFIFK